MSLTEMTLDRDEHPVDMIERLAASHEWAFERSGPDEISISVSGAWTNYSAAFSWLDDLEALHLGCAFDLKVPDRRRGETAKLIALINEQLWVGHFDLWSKEHVVMFRHSLLLSNGLEPGQGQCEDLLRIAAQTCERYYQAFQFVVWAGKSAREALDSAMFDTAGEA